MDSSTAHQEMGLQTLESMLSCTKSQQEKKPRPADMQAQKCPRCDSSNTKFCYYNNYSLSQPRYFCKSCRRYWTKGGTLRNVPVGGGCRKNKRSSSSSSSSSSSLKKSQDQHITPIASPIPSLSYESSDLSLAIARLQRQNSSHLGLEGQDFSIWGHQNVPHYHNGDVLGSFGGNPSSCGMFDAIRNGFLENLSGGSGCYGMGNGNVGVENGGVGIPFEEFGGVSTVAAMAVKQEMCGGEDGDGRVLWGFPRRGQEGDGNGSEYDSARLNWNGIGSSSSWQGLLNSPLM